jgi:hypothetical protein
MCSYHSLIFVCLFETLLLRDNTFAFLLTNDNKSAIRECKENSTLPGYGIVVTHSRPNQTDRGSVLIKTAINNTEDLFNPICTWTYKIQDHKDAVDVQNGALDEGSSVKWIFSLIGLLRVSVTAEFEHRGTQVTIKNCTYVNVTGDYRPKFCCDFPLLIDMSACFFA